MVTNLAAEKARLEQCEAVAFLTPTPDMTDAGRQAAEVAASSANAHLRTGKCIPWLIFPFACVLRVLCAMGKILETSDGRVYTKLFNGHIGLPWKLRAAARTLGAPAVKAADWLARAVEVLRRLSTNPMAGLGGYISRLGRHIPHFDKRHVGADLLFQLNGTTGTVFYSNDTRFAIIALRDGCGSYLAMSGRLGRGSVPGSSVTPTLSPTQAPTPTPAPNPRSYPNPNPMQRRA